MKAIATTARSNRLRVLFVSAEIFPLAKTGGLADVCCALPVALSAEGDLDIVLMVPGYDSVFATGGDWDEIASLPDLPGGPARLLLGTLPGHDLRVVILDQPQCFRRQGGLYVDEHGAEWGDNAERFASLCQAAIAMATGRILPSWRADIIHCNDWHTGLIPVLLKAQYGPVPRTVFTIHNLAFQGVFPAESADRLGVPGRFLSVDGLEYFGKLSFMKGALNFADRLTTVSPSYAEEITTPEFGMGLDGVLKRRQARLVGILNGIDETLWNPANDAILASPYGVDQPDRRALCKAALQAEWGLVADADAPLLVFVARLEAQKMADTLLEILPALMERPGVQVAICGQGAHDLQDGFATRAAAMPDRIAARIGYREEWAHQLLGGGDMLVHGARFEPCGLTPMYAMRYGALPIVRSVGGMKDTVKGVDEASLASGTATGFRFEAPTAAGLLGGVDQALSLFQQKATWRDVQRAAMRSDFSWRGPACEYRRVYDELAAA